MKNQNIIFTATIFVLGILALSPATSALTPLPDGGYPGGNTAEGQNALFSLTTGTSNTAVGFLSLRNNTEGQFNTAIGAGALLANVGDPSVVHGVENTATGAGALLTNSTGAYNTANGAFALFHNTTNGQNTADGALALFNNTGAGNTAVGQSALHNNTTGNFNTAVGNAALAFAGGSSNTAVGSGAGQNVLNANNVICIGQGVLGGDASDSCYIGNIWNQTGGSQAVYVNSDGKLGALVSSRRFKDHIKTMDKASEALLWLKPVAFRYKKEIDPAGTSQFGLVAEDVEKVSPDLVIRDKEGKPYSVRYDQVNAMLLNEFLKEHKKVEAQQSKIEKQEHETQLQDETIAGLESAVAQQQKQIQRLTAGLQQVTVQVAMRKAAPTMARNNP